MFLWSLVQFTAPQLTPYLEDIWNSQNITYLIDLIQCRQINSHIFDQFRRFLLIRTINLNDVFKVFGTTTNPLSRRQKNHSITYLIDLRIKKTFFTNLGNYWRFLPLSIINLSNVLWSLVQFIALQLPP